MVYIYETPKMQVLSVATQDVIRTSVTDPDPANPMGQFEEGTGGTTQW